MRFNLHKKRNIDAEYARRTHCACNLQAQFNGSIFRNSGNSFERLRYSRFTSGWSWKSKLITDR